MKQIEYSAVEPIQDWQKQFEGKLKNAINQYVSNIVGKGVIVCESISVTTKPKYILKNYIENPDGTMVKPSLKGKMYIKLSANGEEKYCCKIYKLDTNAYEYDKQHKLVVKDITSLMSANSYLIP